ncbi:innexin inx1-like [Penaeus chinensis]|uniref:innexin inx1-like n=1 Tax=Penaeus chinensis TaxID=139456 RepID=UPI001FB5A55A|nr:innexin inx1-like [Penaeus chinensis]
MSAIKYLSGLKSYLAREECVNESSVFRLHYQMTVVLLIGSSILLTAAEFFGNPIDCITGLGAKHVINTYCWIHSTFTIQDYYLRRVNACSRACNLGGSHNSPETVPTCIARGQGRDEPYPGIRMSRSTVGVNVGGGQRIPLQVVQIESPCCCISVATTAISVVPTVNLAACTSAMKITVTIVGQLFLIDRFLGGEFLTYGPRVVEYSEMDQEERVDPMIYVFPRMTKCHFHKFGPSGTLERHDAFCLLPLNILNEKVFIMIWFWFVILACLLGALILYRVALFTLPGLRPRAMHKHNKSISLETVQAITNKTSIGDWWILYVLSTNIDPLIYRDIMTTLAKEIETANSNNPYNSAGLYSSSSV